VSSGFAAAKDLDAAFSAASPEELPRAVAAGGAPAVAAEVGRHGGPDSLSP
jgi:hypothetical protein